MATYELEKPLGECVLAVVHPVWSVDKVTLTGGNVALMTVLATVDGKFKPVDFGGEGAAAQAVAVAYEAVDASAGDVQGLVLARGAVVETNALVWPSGATLVQKTAALAELKALGILARSAL